MSWRIFIAVKTPALPKHCRHPSKMLQFAEIFRSLAP
jgi:hypothetical protein